MNEPSIRRTAKRLFACYSRKNEISVRGLVQFLRISGAPVYLDVDSIPAGSKWRSEIKNAIAAADAVVVFWSPDAAESEEVAHEYEIAIHLRKDVVPVLMGSGGPPLPPILAQYQALDLSALFVPHDVTFNWRPYIAEFVDRFS